MLHGSIFHNVEWWNVWVKTLEEGQDAQNLHECLCSDTLQALAMTSWTEILTLRTCNNQPLCMQPGGSGRGGTRAQSLQMRGMDHMDIHGKGGERVTDGLALEEERESLGELGDPVLGNCLRRGIVVAVEVLLDDNPVA